jgi:hypothetical protein
MKTKTKFNAEEEINNITMWLYIIGFSCLFISIYFAFCFNYVDKQLSNVPHKVCENVSEVKEYQYNESLYFSFLSDRYFFNNELIVCPDSYSVEDRGSYKFIDLNWSSVIYNNSTKRVYIEDKCLIQTTKEVCHYE